jgi:hypothetical protein
MALATTQPAHLFILRVWSVEGDDDAPQWRVRLQNIQSGEVTFFKDWHEMIASLEENLNEPNFNRVNSTPEE